MPSRSELGVWCWAASSPRIGRDWSVVLRKRRPLVARGKQEDVGALMPHPGQHLSRFRAGYAERVDLSAMVPSLEIASTGYCLVNSGSECLVCQPVAGEFTADLPAGDYRYECLNPVPVNKAGGGTVSVHGGRQSFLAPFAGDVVLYLRRAR